MESGKKVKKSLSKKKKMQIALAVICVLAAISYIILEHPEIFQKKSDSPKSMYSDRLYSYNFYEADFDRDVTKDEYYMQFDRYVHYKNGNVSVAVLDDEIDEYNNAVKFFVEYFRIVTHGETEKYNELFTEKYYESNEPYVAFTPQMIYNIEVEQLSETELGDGSDKWAFNVTYMIYRNDGTFRNDLDSDSSKKLYFELIEDKNGNIKIDFIDYYRR